MQLFDFTRNTALITGASSSLGEQFIHCLSRADARGILAARGVDKLNALATELNNTKVLEMEVADNNSVQKRFNELADSGEQVEICINNAGIFKATPVFEEDHQDNFESIMQTNVMRVCYAANHTKRLDIHGSIINMGSINGKLSPQKIQGNCIVPESFHTPAAGYKVSTSELREDLEASIPLGFFAEPSDLDGCILHLASNNIPKYVTGSCFIIDNGISWGGKS